MQFNIYYNNSLSNVINLIDIMNQIHFKCKFYLRLFKKIVVV